MSLHPTIFTNACSSVTIIQPSKFDIQERTGSQQWPRCFRLLSKPRNFREKKRVAFLEERIVCVSRGRKHEKMRRNNEGHRCRSKAQITGDRADWHPSKPSQKGDKPLEAFFLENQWRLLFPINKIQRTTISHCSKSQTNFEIQHFDRYT